MEVVEEPVAHNSVVGDVQVNMSEETPVIYDDAGECTKPNGVAEADAAVDSDLAPNLGPVQNQVPVESTVHHEVISVVTTKVCETISIETVVTNEEPIPDTIHDAGDTADQEVIQKQTDNGLTSRIAHEITELFVGNTENAPQNEQVQVEEPLINVPTDTVTFKTEVVVERNENDGNDPVQNDAKADELDASKNILSALRQNLELSDVLQSDSTDHTENNNSSSRQEVLNKEELLDILEGNDVEQADDQFIKIMQVDHSNIKTIEAQLALQQLTRLKSAKPKRPTDRPIQRKKNQTRLSQNNSGTEIKTKKYNKRSEASGVDDSEVISDEIKGKKEKKNLGTSKSSELVVSGMKSTLKDKKSSDLVEPEEAVTTVIKSKTDKQALENSTDNVECVSSETKPKRGRKTVENTVKALEGSVIEDKKKRENCKPSAGDDAEVSHNDDIVTEINKSNSIKENIVNVLVRDWEDDEHEFKDDATEKLLEETEGVVKSVEQLVTAQEVTIDEEHIDGSSMDSSVSCVNEGQALNKSGDEGQPQRRLGRVIKKKVIFDPDNPDTFTKVKTLTKTKETIKPETEKELPTPKKTKMDIQQIPKSKSPTGKLQWKKPPPKASKQNKRLSEVDRLLMDEGAVNMIYQLTPEAPKGKKNMRTKAEFIKKIQSSTPDSKEMKFRERKKEIIKTEDAEAKRIVGGKQRGSLSSSVKSMSICEDFEAHSADDSIIYRRHSSSSYSSNCMSPLRGNEPDSSMGQGAARDSRHPSDNPNLSNADGESVDQISDVFVVEVNTTSPSDVINKSDCLSIKQKLNSKLSHVLNKRKRESAKTDKPAKQKRLVAKHDEMKTSIVKSEDDLNMAKMKTVTITFNNNLAEICVKRKGDFYNIQTLKDLQQALVNVDSKEDITVTLLTSECGTLCSTLDLRSILEENLETRTINAFELAESIRCLLSTVERHSKLLCTGAWGPCWGLGLALAALSDVALASERARFALDAGAPLALAAAALASRLPRSTVDELVLFGRQLSAQEALSGGLLSRVLWPERCAAQLRDAAADLARQPARSLLLKKQLLTLSRSEKTFQSYLEAERNLVADYWTSAEFQEALRASLGA